IRQRRRPANSRTRLYPPGRGKCGVWSWHASDEFADLALVGKAPESVERPHDRPDLADDEVLIDEPASGLVLVPHGVGRVGTVVAHDPQLAVGHGDVELATL